MIVVVVAGNEGAGKTTLAKRLRKAQFQVKEYEPVEIRPGSENELFLILDVPIEIAQQRLKAAGKNLDISPHTKKDLGQYRDHYLEVAKELPCCQVIDATHSQADMFAIALNAISLLVAQRHQVSLSQF